MKTDAGIVSLYESYRRAISYNENNVAAILTLAHVIKHCTADDESSEPEMLNVSQVAERLGISIPTVRRMIRDGSLKSVKIGPKMRSLRIPSEAVDQYVQSAPTPLTDEDPEWTY